MVCLVKYRNRTYSLGEKLNPQTASTADKVDKYRRNATQRETDPHLVAALSTPHPKDKLSFFEKAATTATNSFDKHFACINAALIYRDGLQTPSDTNVAKDLDKAIYWLKQAIVEGDVQDVNGICAGDILADIYFDNPNTLPKTVEEIYELAANLSKPTERRFKLMDIAAKRGNIEAIYEVAVDLFHGSPSAKVERNLTAAIELFKQAAAKNKGEACVILANIYFFGERGAIPVNPQEGAKWLLMAFTCGKQDVFLSQWTDSSLITHRKLHDRQDAIDYIKEKWKIEIPA